VLEMLQRAQTKLHDGEAGEALRLLGELDRQSPGSPLLEERLVTRALAACELGDVAQARQASRELERLDGESIYRGRLEASCVATTLQGDEE
jgi:outer membrane protein assembly factor BamD (BamD/ComL family)